MKRWMLFGIALCILLAGTFAALIGFFFADFSAALSGDIPTLATTDPFTSSATTEATEETPPETTEETIPETTAETVPETTAETIPETTAETIPETTPETKPAPPPETKPEPKPEPETQPPTQAPTEPPTQPPTQAPTEPSAPTISNISASYGFVYDLTNGTYLHSFGNQNKAISIASITKLFTAYVALQHMDLKTVITAGKEVNLIDSNSSRAWIYEGQKVTVEMLVRGMIIPSGNDAAYILAVATGRKLLNDPDASIQSALDAFVAEMNNQASSLGLSGSHFANPDGIDNKNHYSTCADVLTIAKLALNNSTIRKCAATARVTQIYVSGEMSIWTNSNRLLNKNTDYYCEDAFGLKTGHTANAGYCLVSAFDTGDRTLIIGVFGCSSMYQRDIDTLALYKHFK